MEVIKVMKQDHRFLSLDGLWECGEDRNYTRTVTVPGLAADPCKINKEALWFKKTVTLPCGDWTHATLILNGARFCPSVYIDGDRVSCKSGGMTVTKHPLPHTSVRPGQRIALEIELKSLNDVPADDASRIPAADLWRTNLSSCIWDTVKIKFHGAVRIKRLIPYYEQSKDTVAVEWELDKPENCCESCTLYFQIIGGNNKILAESTIKSSNEKGSAVIQLNGGCSQWSPEDPVCYTLKVVAELNGKTTDTDEMTLGLKEFKIDGLKFTLNNKPVKLRAGTVVWHRWLRDPEARELAFDTEWFERNVVLRLMGHGANTLRFHLGTPPERLLDLCDRHGVMVQLEWLFFHGMKGGRESIVEQWRNWLDLAMRHPSVCIIHPWNETEGDELKTAYDALDALAVEYPPLVISHRDVIHIHKYWWSLFENVGVYYDSAAQFDKPIMVDEFGGNYLDGEGNPGLYPCIRESFLRFLGYNHTKEERLELQILSNARIAEYWRRIGAAGFSPFCILGSPEDGNHHFMGKLRDGNPKPVWDALTAAYSPISVSIDVWDRNFIPGQSVPLPVLFFNDTGTDSVLDVVVRVVNKDDNHIITQVKLNRAVPRYSTVKQDIRLELPHVGGNWRFEAFLLNAPTAIKHPVISSWGFRTMTVKANDAIKGVRVGIPSADEELIGFFRENDIEVCPADSPRADVVITGRRSWEQLSDAIRSVLKNAVYRNRPVLMLDIGPIELGQGYLKNDVGRLQGIMRLNNPESYKEELFDGIQLMFRQVPEPESCIHPSDSGEPLWWNLDRRATWLWNGLRGGLIVPAMDIEINGMSREAFLSLWKSRGADESLIKQGNYYAYELAGYFAFSVGDDPKAKADLLARVKFLLEDAPALADVINPRVPILSHNLSELYKLNTGTIRKLSPLVKCGKSLVRTPLYKADFGRGKGSMILSQLITSGRLVKGFGQEGLYGIRQDPAARQFVLNMVKYLIDTREG